MAEIPELFLKLADLRDRDLRAEGLFAAEGRLLVERALASSSCDVLGIIADEASGAEALACATSNIPVYVCAKEEISSHVGFQFHRGMIALAKRPVIKRAMDAETHDGSVLVLPEIVDPGNLGALLRSALAFGFTTVYLGTRSCDPFNRKCLRSSMGAALSLALFEAEPRDLEALARAGYLVLAAAMEERSLVSGVRGVDDRDGLLPEGTVLSAIADKRIALALGNEHDGIPDIWRSQCRAAIRLPVSNAVDSLNVAVAGSILMRDLSRP